MTYVTKQVETPIGVIDGSTRPCTWMLELGAGSFLNDHAGQRSRSPGGSCRG